MPLNVWCVIVELSPLIYGDRRCCTLDICSYLDRYSLKMMMCFGSPRDVVVDKNYNQLTYLLTNMALSCSKQCNSTAGVHDALRL